VPASALFLALAAACLHALWNVLIARARDVEAATAVAVSLSVVLFAPIAALTWNVGREAIPYLIAGAVLHLVYFSLLAAAYRRAEVGLVYPLSRGLAPVLVLAVTALALADDPTAGQALGVILVALGVVLVRGFGGLADPVGTAFGLAIAGCIAAYTLVDNAGIEYASPIPYLEMLLLAPAVLYTSAIWALRGAGGLRAALGPSTVVSALAMFGAYALVLAALNIAPAAPVAAVRETSVVIAAVLAVIVLREPLSWRRLAGAVLVAIGIVTLAIA
jgi:drug/metabolite transporter (DMT)-like permease